MNHRPITMSVPTWEGKKSPSWCRFHGAVQEQQTERLQQQAEQLEQQEAQLADMRAAKLALEERVLRAEAVVADVLRGEGMRSRADRPPASDAVPAVPPSGDAAVQER